MSRGQIFTVEAIIALLFLSSSFFILSALGPKPGSDVYGTVFLSDTFEVVEHNYHTQLADSCRSGALSPDLVALFEFIGNQTGKRVFLKSERMARPCEPSLVATRMTTYSEIGIAGPEIVWRQVGIGLCR